MRALLLVLLAGCGNSNSINVQLSPPVDSSSTQTNGEDMRHLSTGGGVRLRHVLVLGDSISADGSAGTQGAWRLPFITNMMSNGFPDMVTTGTQQTDYGVNQYTAAQKQSAYSLARSGYRVSNILYRDGRPNPIAASGWDVAGLQGGDLYPGDPCDTANCGTPGGYDLSTAGHIDVFVPMLSPDAVIVMIGTNDIYNVIGLPDGDPTQTHLRLQAMLLRLATYMPEGAIMFVCKIPGFIGDATRLANRLAYNAAIEATVVPAVVATGVPAFVIDANQGFNTATMLQLDDLHPNALGMTTIGNTIASQILTIASANGYSP